MVARKNIKLGYACGLSLSATKKNMKFFFERFYYTTKANEQTWMFDIFIHEEVFIEEKGRNVHYLEHFGENFINRFKEYWSEKPGYTLNIIKLEFKEQL